MEPSAEPTVAARDLRKFARMRWRAVVSTDCSEEGRWPRAATHWSLSETRPNRTPELPRRAPSRRYNPQIPATLSMGVRDRRDSPPSTLLRRASLRATIAHPELIRGGPMKRSLALLLLFVPFTAAQASDKDEWIGTWVLPRTEKVPLCDKDGKPLGSVFYGTGKVISTGKTHLQVRQGHNRGPREGYVLKT